MGRWVIGKYIRLSQADRDIVKNDSKSESESITHQKSLIQNYILSDPELKSCEQYEYFDDGYSGTNFARPSFEKMIERIKKGEINCVIVKDFSRFGRDYIELGDYLERIFPFLGVRFISINDHYDSLDYKGTTGGLDVVMKNIVYDYYSKDLSVKVKTAKLQKMKQGKYLGGHIPFGYKKDPEDKHKLVVDPDAAAIVREIFDMALSGMRLIDMAISLNERNVETPAAYYRRMHPKSTKYEGTSDKAGWNHNNLRSILKNEIYYGCVVGHKREALCIGSVHTAAVPKEEQIIIEGKHEGIVTKEEFLKVQEMFIRKGKKKKSVDKTYPLYRKVSCGNCGRSMAYKSYSFRGRQYQYFMCPHHQSQVGEGKCSGRYVHEEELNEVVWAAAKKLISLTDVLKQRMDSQKAASAEDNLLLAEKLASLQRDKEKCESERFANVDQFMAGTLDKDIYQIRRAELTRKAEKIDAEIAQTEQMLKEAETVGDGTAAEAYSALKKYDGADSLNQQMVEELVERVLVTDPEHVEIIWKFSDEVMKLIED